jgi:DNA-binding LacI/PurR family transcriptional regulator
LSLDLIWAREPRLQARRLTSILLARGINGVVVGPRPVQPRPEILDWARFSAASVGVPVPNVQLHQAGSHHARLMQHLLATLQARGYRRPGLVLLEAQISRSDPGWVAMWTYQQQALAPRHRVPLLALPAFQPRSIARWLDRHEPDVVIGVEAGLLDVLQRTGRRVPEDIGFAHLSRPEAPDAPAGMDQRPRDIGAAAVELVAAQVFAAERGLPASPRVMLVEAQWCDGWTVRAN